MLGRHGRRSPVPATCETRVGPFFYKRGVDWVVGPRQRLAKTLNPGQELELTAADSIVGTPLYLAPEGVERPESLGCAQ